MPLEETLGECGPLTVIMDEREMIHKRFHNKSSEFV